MRHRQQRRLLTIKCPVELSQGLQSVQSVLGQSVAALGIPPHRLSSTSDSLFASHTVHASQWAPLLIGCMYKLPPTWSVFNNSSRPNIPFLKIHFFDIVGVSDVVFWHFLGKNSYIKAVTTFIVPFNDIHPTF